jgi:DNA-binding CsgD family transcriptional regulator/predicted negative regulator of RcsB-dependent stress response
VDASRLPERQTPDDESGHLLIERETPFELAAGALARARAGRGTLLVLEGSGGTGKSSLLAAVRGAPSGGMTILSAGGRGLEQGFSFGVVLQLFESHLARVPDGERARLLAGGAREAVPLFAPGPRPALSEGSFSLLHGLYRLCGNLAEPGGLAILVDDVDIADEASIRFLLYLAERVEELPAAIVLSSGSAAGGADQDLLGQLLSHPAAVRYRLQPFTALGTARQLRSDGFPTASEDFCVAVHVATRGNPSLVRQLSEALLDGAVEPDAAVLRRAAAVDPDGPVLLRAVALLGNGAKLRHAAGLAGLDPERTLDLADGLMAAGLLEDGTPLSFVHPVAAAAVAANQRPAEWAGANLRAARLLRDDEAPAEQVAAHLLEATRAGSDWAVGVLGEAAEAALARGDPDAAVRYLRRALDEPPPSEMRAHVVLQLGRAEATAGEPEAVPRLSEVMARGREGHQRASAALDAGRTLFALGRHEDAAAAFRHGVDQVGEQDHELGGRLRAAYATVSRLHPRAAQVTVEAEPPPERNETPADRARLALLAMESAVRGDPHEQVHELGVRALARGALLDEDTADGIAYYLAASALALTDDLQTAEVALTAAVQDAQARGSVLGFATASYFRSLTIMRRGRVADAAADARQAIAAEQHGWRLAIPAARAVLAETMVERGDLDAARTQLETAEQSATESHPARLGLLAASGSMHLLSGEAEHALSDFLACRDYLEAIGARNPALLPWRSGAARASALLGDSSEGRRLAEEELALAEAFGAPGPVGRALRTLGAVREGAAALEALEAAVARLERSQSALERARALVDFGAALRRSGQRRAAREPLRRGLDLAERCGATTLAARALREAHAAGARPRRTAVHGLEALTPRERQVASLAAQGLSNREIAEALVVTVKTVEWHLRHSFEKLEVSSRGKLRELFADEQD